MDARPTRPWGTISPKARKGARVICPFRWVTMRPSPERKRVANPPTGPVLRSFATHLVLRLIRKQDRGLQKEAAKSVVGGGHQTEDLEGASTQTPRPPHQHASSQT